MKCVVAYYKSCVKGDSGCWYVWYHLSSPKFGGLIAHTRTDNR